MSVSLVTVEPYGAGAQSSRRLVRRAQVRAPDRSRETRWKTIGQRDRLIQVVEIEYRQHRPENFVADKRYAVVRTVEHRGLDVLFARFGEYPPASR